MDAHTRQLEAIFEHTIFFQVPLFQRPYVWSQKGNWEPLWDDIESLLHKCLKTGTVRAHFLGAVVLEQIPHPTGSIETRLVIDGQQRFTTLQLLLIAARNLASECDEPKFADRFTGFVENKASRVDDPKEKFKLWPTNSDREAFKAIHGCQSLHALEKLAKDHKGLAKSNLVSAYRYFHTKLAGWLNGELDDEDDASVFEDKQTSDRIEAFWQIAQRGLQLVVINLDKDDETQVIFETLNARGTELLPADLIKNYLFRKASSEEADVEALYEEYWAHFESNFWRKEIKQGRLKRPRIDLFINHYLTLMLCDEVKPAHLFNAFRNFVEQGTPAEEGGIPCPGTAAKHIIQLSRYAKVFLRFFEPTEHPAMARFIKCLQVVDTATVYPFMLHAYMKLMPEHRDEFDRVLELLEAFLMRRLITNYTSKNYNRLFVELIRSVQRSGEVSAKSFADQLAKGAGESTRFPTDKELANVILEMPLYGRIAQYKVRAVLEALDHAAQSRKSPNLVIEDKLTIEHVMPQKWEKHWPLPDSIQGNPAAKQEAEERRRLYLNTLGNLTLITGSFNSSLKNAAWSNKRPELLKYSKLNLTQYFHEARADRWDEEAIEDRSRYLLSLLVETWPEVSAFQ